MREAKLLAATQCVLALRQRTGETQQCFATRLGHSISSFANYEVGTRQIGDAAVLVSLLREARRQLCPRYEERLRLALLELLKTSSAELSDLLCDVYDKREVAS